LSARALQSQKAFRIEYEFLKECTKNGDPTASFQMSTLLPGNVITKIGEQRYGLGEACAIAVPTEYADPSSGSGDHPKRPCLKKKN